MWKIGDRVRHRWNAELGPGLVTSLEGRRVSVLFPESGETLQIASSSDALAALELEVGARARIVETGEAVTIEAIDEDLVTVSGGREFASQALWPLPESPSPLVRLKRGDIDAYEDFRNRLDGLRLMKLRRADGLGTFLGGRIQIFPHQLHAAERATAVTRPAVVLGDPEDLEADEDGFGPAPEAHGVVRWLLADEVGLGKTVEACLIMNRLLHTGRIERALVVAPDTLTVQWLGELWRKYHQVFVLLDDQRLEDVEIEYGVGFNPFDVYRQAIVSIERLTQDRKLAELAAEAGIDLLVVDEAHHLRRAVGQPGNAAYQAVRSIANLGHHVLLATATPLEDDAHGFFRLLQILRPDEFPEDSTLLERLERREPLPACTSAARRRDIGGMPPRVGVAIEIDDAEGWGALEAVVEIERARNTQNTAQESDKAERVWRALASPDALATAPQPTSGSPIEPSLLSRAKRLDPRLAWLREQSTGWAKRREKTLIFVAHRESLDAVRSALDRIKVAVFHEDLAVERRDLEVARFRAVDGPTVLISTESGGEGRNFEFCHRLVLFDLPWHPAVVEQRIGRLDRIGRKRDVEVCYFLRPSGFDRSVAELYQKIGLFREPLGGLVRELRHVADAVTERATSSEAVTLDDFRTVLDEARDAADRVQEAAFHELHREPYEAHMAESILSRVPSELDAVTEDVVMRAAARFGFECEPQRRPRTWMIEFGSQALIDHLPGVAAGSRYLGTFSREVAVADESVDFFASGHPLVEGILLELEDGDRGRVAVFQAVAPKGSEPTFGILALYRDGARVEALVVDAKGEARADLAEHLMQADFEAVPMDAKITQQPSWKRAVSTLSKTLPKDDQPVAVAAFRLTPASPTP